MKIKFILSTIILSLQVSYQQESVINNPSDQLKSVSLFEIIKRDSLLEHHIGRCVTSIATKYLNGPILVVVTPDVSSRVLTELHFLSDWPLFVATSGSNMKTNRSSKASGFIFLLEADEHLGNLLHVVQSHPAWNSRARFAVAVTGKIIPNGEKIISTILNAFWERNVINVIVLLPQTDYKAILVHTWFPFSQYHCRGPVIESSLLDKWLLEDKGRFSEGVFLFPEKLKDLQGCSLDVNTFPYEPFILPRKRKCPEGTNICYSSGLEINLLRTLSETLNFRIVYLIPPNDTWVGLRRDLANRATDIVIASMTQKANSSKTYEISTIYIHDTLTWFSPSGEQSPQWENITEIFSELIWGLLSLSFIFLSLVIWQLATLDKSEHTSYQSAFNCFFKVFCVLLGNTVDIKPRAFLVRVTFCMWLLFALIIGTAYQSSLVSFLTNPRFDATIGTMKELMKSDLKCGMYPGTISWFEDNPYESQILNKLVDCFDVDNCAKQMAYKRNMALLGGKLHLTFLSATKYNNRGTPLYVPFRESVSFYYISMAFPKDTILLDRFNEVIGRIVQSGFVGYWWGIIKNRKIRQTEDDSDDADEKNDLQVLTVQNLQGAFFIVVLGSGFALFVFLIETVHFNLTANARNKTIL